ncbi:ribonuclease H-like domain-containing protein [Mycena haematopus]|nr:ribonuclease H-like domain-containing protein [Mycena haematopus]
MQSEAHFVLCDKESELPAVAKTLQASPVLFLDCEGDNLGVKSGHLSLISLGTPTQEGAYIINVLAIGKAGLQPIFNLLESTEVRKVVFDGRMDQSALFHEYGVTMQNVVDLQLADIKSRRSRGEDEEDQRGRLSPYLHRNEVETNATLYRGVHKLAGLGQALKEHKIDADEEKLMIKSIAGVIGPFGNPPSPLHLQYAANDIGLISQLWAHFAHQSYIDGDLPAQSSRYVRMWLGGQPKEGDTYKLHALLPLGILDDVACRTKQG